MTKFIPMNMGKGHINYSGGFIEFIMIECFLVGFLIILKKRNNCCISYITIRRLCYLQVKRKYIDVLFLHGILLASLYFQVRLKMGYSVVRATNGNKVIFLDYLEFTQDLRLEIWLYRKNIKKQLTLLASATQKLRSKWRKCRAVSRSSIFLCALKTREACYVTQTKYHLWRQITSQIYDCFEQTVYN